MSILVKMVSVGMACLTATAFPRSLRAEERGLDEFIQEKMKVNNVPGLAACIVKKSGMVWSRGFGWADIENKIPMTDQTIQNIGSISKTITATAGLCWYKTELKSGDVVWCHGGRDPGITTQMFFRPKDGVGVIIFLNCDSLGNAREEIGERLFEEAAKF